MENSTKVKKKYKKKKLSAKVIPKKLEYMTNVIPEPEWAKNVLVTEDNSLNSDLLKGEKEEKKSVKVKPTKKKDTSYDRFNNILKKIDFTEKEKKVLEDIKSNCKKCMSRPLFPFIEALTLLLGRYVTGERPLVYIVNKDYMCVEIANYLESKKPVKEIIKAKTKDGHKYKYHLIGGSKFYLTSKNNLSSLKEEEDISEWDTFFVHANR